MQSIKSKLLLAATVLTLSSGLMAKDITLLNVSYDPTRELYRDYNKAFSAYWQQKPVITSKLNNHMVAPAASHVLSLMA